MKTNKYFNASCHHAPAQPFPLCAPDDRGMELFSRTGRRKQQAGQRAGRRFPFCTAKPSGSA
uniref:hypothetical protein n=1 Tax=Hydrogenophaga sp. TaxID=1904254 RepID=UPI0040358187